QCGPRAARAPGGRRRRRGTTRGAAAAAILTAVAVAAFAAPPASAQCGETIDLAPRVAVGPGPAPLAVGDSVLYDAAQPLAGYGFHINAMVCRTMAQGIVWLQQHDQNLPSIVVVALGTNGAVTTAQIDQLLSLVGPSRVLAMVTPHHGNYAYVPDLIRSAAHQHRGRILVLDWDALSTGHASWFASDGIHLASAAGIGAFARLVEGALLATPARVPSVTVTTPAVPRTGPGPAVPKPPKSQPEPAEAALIRPVLSAAAAVNDWLVSPW
ncbi:MAG: hypothetical protein QOJ25_423, partial [Solirubrobacteraceae bacterium]|nr:hypothetical protein [Solirubrobacteraceae bacterium]